MASNEENVSIWWRHHDDNQCVTDLCICFVKFFIFIYFITKRHLPQHIKNTSWSNYQHGKYIFVFNALKSKQHGWHFTDTTFRCILLKKICTHCVIFLFPGVIYNDCNIISPTGSVPFASTVSCLNQVWKCCLQNVSLFAWHFEDISTCKLSTRPHFYQTGSA